MPKYIITSEGWKYINKYLSDEAYDRFVEEINNTIYKGKIPYSTTKDRLCFDLHIVGSGISIKFILPVKFLRLYKQFNLDNIEPGIWYSLENVDIEEISFKYKNIDAVIRRKSKTDTNNNKKFSYDNDFYYYNTYININNELVIYNSEEEDEHGSASNTLKKDNYKDYYILFLPACNKD